MGTFPVSTAQRLVMGDPSVRVAEIRKVRCLMRTMMLQVEGGGEVALHGGAMVAERTQHEGTAGHALEDAPILDSPGAVSKCFVLPRSGEAQSVDILRFERGEVGETEKAQSGVHSGRGNVRNQMSCMVEQEWQYLTLIAVD
ncbi:hypothetical protein DDV98_14615 [Streptomyces sp. IB2014 011-12]|nr:hypothetical protein DDV98_14615 [Streptomyces sp. IB2014 011-12]